MWKIVPNKLWYLHYNNKAIMKSEKLCVIVKNYKNMVKIDKKDKKSCTTK